MAIMDKKTEIQLKNVPLDIISSVKFAPNSNQFLLVSSWDSKVYLYDVLNNTLRQKLSHDSPVLDIAFQVNENYITDCYKYDYLTKSHITGSSTYCERRSK